MARIRRDGYSRRWAELHDEKNSGPTKCGKRRRKKRVPANEKGRALFNTLSCSMTRIKQKTDDRRTDRRPITDASACCLGLLCLYGSCSKSKLMLQIKYEKRDNKTHFVIVLSLIVATWRERVLAYRSLHLTLILFYSLVVVTVDVYVYMFSTCT
jgi:hypothetical protein